MKMIIATAVLSLAIGSQAFADSLINLGGGSRSLISVSPQVSLLNNNRTNILSNILNGNSILNGSSLLSDNDNNGLLGLGILSGNNSGNSYTKTRRGGCGCR